MRKLLIIIAVAICFGASSDAQKLVLPGEHLVFSFRTLNNKKVVVASGLDGKYLVYRYGTDMKTELQYPAVLDSQSWQKFSYSGLIRGVNFDTTGALDLNFVTFCSGHYRYIIYRTSYDGDCAVGVKVQDITKRKTVDIKGNYKSIKGDLSDFRGDERVIQSDKMYED